MGWRQVGQDYAPAMDKVQPLLDDAAKSYVEKNTGWPTRTESCDSKS
jgi:branched-chain amino acid transport system substrate-binding protein